MHVADIRRFEMRCVDQMPLFESIMGWCVSYRDGQSEQTINYLHDVGEDLRQLGQPWWYLRKIEVGNDAISH